MKRSKKYLKTATKVDSNKQYDVKDAIKLAKDISYTNFTGALNITINFNVPNKLKKEVIRGNITLPNQDKKNSKKVALLVDSADLTKAKKTEADVVGSDDLIKDIQGGKLDFDILVTTPQMMGKLAPLGKILGPKGLMPNPKNETVTTDFERVVKSYKGGKMDYRIDPGGSIKAKIGKLDMSEKELEDNFAIFVETVYKDTKKLGPQRIKAVYLAPTMGKSIRISKSDLLSNYI